LLAQIYNDLKQPVESHRYLAEYYYAIGQTEAAILQIKLAQKSPGLNFYLSAILDERLGYFIHEEQERKRNQ
jgi:predicted Zn-dependent protease